MAKITFTGVPGEEDIRGIHQYGVDFPLGKPVEVDTRIPRKQIEKLKLHPHFSVDDDITDVQAKPPKTPKDQLPPLDSSPAKHPSEGKPTRAELEQTATALGVKFDDKTSDDDLIAASEKAAAESDKGKKK